MFHGSNNRKQDAITDPAANYECDVQDDLTCLTEHKTCIIPAFLNPAVALPQLRQRSQRRCSTSVIIHFLSLFGDLPATFIGDKRIFNFFTTFVRNFFPAGKYLASYARDARKKTGRQAGRQAKCLLQQLHCCQRILAQSNNLGLMQIRPALLDLTSTSTTGLHERVDSQVQNLGEHNPFQISFRSLS
jgi:hypothetical protein